MRNHSNHFSRKQKGFTLVEVLVVILILGVLAAIAIPNIAKFIGYGREDVGRVELSEISNCVAAAKADMPVTETIVPADFGNTLHADPPTGTDLTVGTKRVSNYITGGIVKCLGHYHVDAQGNVTQLWYPNS